MSAARAKLRVDARNIHGECVLWDAANGLVRWTDIQQKQLWSLHPLTGEVQVRMLPERVCNFALTADPQRQLLGLDCGFAGADFTLGEMEGLCEVEPDLGFTRLNDGRCDRAGNFVFGTIDEAECKPRGSFYRFTRAGKLQRLDLPAPAIPNSICFSPDGTTMYFADSLSGRIMCCDYVAASGKVSRIRLFAALEAGEPDGSTIDAEGCLWNAQWGIGRVARYRPDGSLERVIELPVPQPSCIAFGGAALDTLYISSASKGMTDEAQAKAPAAGGLFAIRLDDVRGLPESLFGGAW